MAQKFIIAEDIKTGRGGYLRMGEVDQHAELSVVLCNLLERGGTYSLPYV